MIRIHFQHPDSGVAVTAAWAGPGHAPSFSSDDETIGRDPTVVDAACDWPELRRPFQTQQALVHALVTASGLRRDDLEVTE